jgi:UMF1 family MFS transporter
MSKSIEPQLRLSAAGTPAADLKGQYSWAMLQWARDCYGILVVVYVFAPYYTTHVVGDPVQGQAIWGYINAIGGVLTALLGPCFGAIADLTGRRKPWLAAFIGIMVVLAFSLWWSLPNNGGLGIYGTALIMVVLTFIYNSNDIFQSSMLPSVAPPERIGFLSGLGVASSQAAAVVGLAFVLFCFMLPGQVDWSFIPDQVLFGLDTSTYEESRIVGPIGALWAIIFSIPFFLFTPDTPRKRDVTFRSAIAMGLGRVFATVRDVKHYRNVMTFLVARLFYNDGKVAILLFSAIYAAGVFNWSALKLTLFGLFASLVASAGALLGGFLDDKFGSKRAIFIAMGGASLGLLTIISLTPTSIFFFINFEDGQVPQTGLPLFETLPDLLFLVIASLNCALINAGFANSRAMMARIAPIEKMSEFFGLYALSGTITAFLGPLVVGMVTTLTHSQRLGMASLLILLVTGLVILLFVREERAKAVA